MKIYYIGNSQFELATRYIPLSDGSLPEYNRKHIEVDKLEEADLLFMDNFSAILNPYRVFNWEDLFKHTAVYGAIDSFNKLQKNIEVFNQALALKKMIITTKEAAILPFLYSGFKSVGTHYKKGTHVQFYNGVIRSTTALNNFLICKDNVDIVHRITAVCSLDTILTFKDPSTNKDVQYENTDYIEAANLLGINTYALNFQLSDAPELTASIITFFRSAIPKSNVVSPKI